MLVPLKITTEYSLLQSTIRISELITFLQKNNITSCAICDESLYGLMDFYKQMQKANLKPIIGLKVFINNYELLLYAKNNNGLKDLLKIHTLKEENNLNINNLKEYLNNIKIVLPINSYELLEEFNNAYLGYTCDTEKINALLKTDRVVFYRDIRSLNETDTKYLKILEAIKKGILLTEIKTNYKNNYISFNVKKEDELTTMEFIKDINIEITYNNNYIPTYDKNINSYEHLSNLAKKGLMKRLNGNIPNNYLERLNYELSVIKKMGFVDYFLIVYDYVLYAKKNNILVGPGRGSAAGSLVSYSIGITNIDPIKYDLLFERFLNPERITMPDIDIDFEYTKRGLVIDYVRNRYGNYNVAPIMTFGTLGSKQVIRDVARVLDISLELIDNFVSHIDAKISLKENLKNEKVKEFLNIYKELKQLYEISLRLEGLKRHISTHAAGIVISSVPLDEVIPICKTGNEIMTGVTMEYLEELGLLKMDFLALRNLTIISNVLELIKENTGKILDINKIPLNEEKVFKLFAEADTEGVFQYESSGMKNLMRKLKPSSFSDLVASVALFRPGPMQNIDSFIRRKYKKEKITYLHPDLEPILKETYGIIVYQEQVMQILVKVGGYTYAEADNIRRAMSKKKESVMLEDKKHFITKAISLGYQDNIAKEIYNLILKFANYGFNKAHSVSYALIGYQMAYLKSKFPLYFIANLLNMSLGSTIKTKEYIDEAKKNNIGILKPSINFSTNQYEIINNKLMLPLNSIKNLGTNATISILEERDKSGKYKDYLDFVTRTYGKSVNKKTLISLIDAGVLDEFNETKKTMIENLDVAINYASLVSELDVSFCIPPEIIKHEEFNEEDLRLKEYSSFGFYVTNHPASKYNKNGIIKIENIKNYFDKHIKCVVLVEKIKTTKTKKGDNMAFITASDETGTCDFVVFPMAYYMLDNVKIGMIINIEGKVTKRFNNYQINIDFLNLIKDNNKDN